jgi:two-component system chemotaxis response regulator CheB
LITQQSKGVPIMIKVLIVEDSPVAREFLIHILSSDPAIQVEGVAGNGLEALETVRQKRPDIITMDLHMPLMDGFEATRKIMETLPTPIVVVIASTSATEVAATFRAMEAGALAVILRPPGIGHPEHEAAARELIQTVKLMSEVKVVRRINHAAEARMAAASPIAPSPILPTGIQVAAMGASTGGPPVLQKILSLLPQDLPFRSAHRVGVRQRFCRVACRYVPLAGADRVARRASIARPGLHCPG